MATPMKGKSTRARRKEEEQREQADLASRTAIHSFAYGDTTFQLSVVVTATMRKVVLHRLDTEWGLTIDATSARELGIQLLRAADMIDPNGSSFSESQPETLSTGRRRDATGRFI